MPDPQVIMEWLNKADEDLEFAVSVMEESTFHAQICFHFHQAAERKKLSRQERQRFIYATR